jgi:hypothetical protein
MLAESSVRDTIGGRRNREIKMRQGRVLARLIASALLIGVLVGVLITAGCTYYPYSPPPLAFSGESSAAKDTAVVPTLDTPAPKGRNVIWCGAFQLCLDDIKPLLAPLGTPASQDMIRRLDHAHINVGDMPKGRYYAVAGPLKGGIVGKMKSEMAARFPKVQPNLPSLDNDVVLLAYAYLNDTLKFHTAYFDRERGDDFIDSGGKTTHVASFGLYNRRDADVNTTLGRQIEILYNDKQYPQQEFVVDLDRNSGPTQLILACVAPKESLAATWQEVQRKVAEWKPAQSERTFGTDDSLAVPDLNYKIHHSFTELETSGLLETSQVIEFRLDRSGASVASESFIKSPSTAGMGRRFSFTRPFLIAMRNRGEAEPYFVMWVDNAELLCK